MASNLDRKRYRVVVFYRATKKEVREGWASRDGFLYGNNYLVHTGNGYAFSAEAHAMAMDVSKRLGRTGKVCILDKTENDKSVANFVGGKLQFCGYGKES